MILQAVVGGFVLDALFGDPAWLPHPVVLMGRCISRLEKFLRARLPGTPQGELLGGAVTAFCLPVGTFLVTSLVCLAAHDQKDTANQTEQPDSLPFFPYMYHFFILYYRQNH